MVPSIWYLWFLLVLPVYSSYYFTNPPPDSDAANPVYTIGDSLNIQWAATDGENDYIDLLLWQVGTDKERQILSNVSGLWQDLWVIKINSDQNLTQSNQFFLSLYISGDTDPLTSSHNFNLTEPSTTTTSTTVSSTSTTTGPTSTFPTPTATHANGLTTSTPTSSASTGKSQSSSGLSTGAKVGIGVGIPVAVIAGVALGVLFARRNQNKAPMGPMQEQPAQVSPSYQYQPSYTHVPAEELPDTSTTVPSEPSEMPVSYK